MEIRWILLYIVFVPLSVVGLMTLVVRFAEWSLQIEKEAKEHNKRIEYGLLGATIMAVLVSIAAFAFTIYSNNSIDSRISSLEIQIKDLQKSKGNTK